MTKGNGSEELRCSQGCLGEIAFHLSGIIGYKLVLSNRSGGRALPEPYLISVSLFLSKHFFALCQREEKGDQVR